VVAHNPIIVQMMEDLIGRPIRVPEKPQLTGAIGAALYAMSAASETVTLNPMEEPNG
jgi:activator of 2-hydroxyglutaryl-CoA dehydratase